MDKHDTNAAHLDRLWSILPKEQIDRVFNDELCDIDGSFLGFTDIYENLSKIIPKHFTVVDLGCAYNPQCFYFQNHKKYIAVDSEIRERFKSYNCIIYNKTIGQFITEDLKQLNLSETFAICSYVPFSHGDSSQLVRETFPNLFVYYPHGGKSLKCINGKFTITE